MSKGHQGGRDCGAKKEYDRFYVASLARDCTKDAIGLLVSVLNDKSAKKNDRIKAAEVLLDRGWGKAPQEVRLGNVDDEGLKIMVEVVNANTNGTTERGQS